MDEVKKVKGLVHDIVDRIVNTVEEIHESIVDASPEGLGKVAPDQAEPVIDQAKDADKAAAGNVYEIIRLINRRVSEVTDEILDKSPETEEKSPEC